MIKTVEEILDEAVIVGFGFLDQDKLKERWEKIE